MTPDALDRDQDKSTVLTLFGLDLALWHNTCGHDTSPHSAASSSTCASALPALCPAFLYSPTANCMASPKRWSLGHHSLCPSRSIEELPGPGQRSHFAIFFHFFREQLDFLFGPISLSDPALQLQMIYLILRFHLFVYSEIQDPCLTPVKLSSRLA